MAVTEEQLKELETKYGRVAHVKGANGAWEIVLRKPKRLEYKSFRANAHNPVAKADAQEALVRQLIVVPEKGEIDALLDDWCGIPEACTKAIEQLSGVATDELAK